MLAKIPVIDILPHMATIAQARQQFIEDIQLKMSQVPEYQRFSFDKLDEVAEPILRDMQTVRTSLSNKFTQTHTWKMSIIIGIASFIISMVLLFFIYLVHKYGKRYAKLMRSEKGIIPRPVLIVTDDEYQILNIHPECRMLKENVVINQTQLMSALSYSGTVQQTSAPPMDMKFFCQQLTNNLKQV